VPYLQPHAKVSFCFSQKKKTFHICLRDFTSPFPNWDRFA
jgi:hypothetical protein